ncbi:MAG: T9SS C-terminal target domain-containing protein, partial [Saprospiraceae bacterium]|nr:T9SS C-terminal target domain-containing protein [Saprospiraceae bacterium]
MNKKYLVGILLLITLTSFNTFGQSAPIKIALEPLTISGLNGLQSFAVGQHSGRWLIVGGRLDGLHQRQPFAAFGADGINDQLIVIDPVTQQNWVAPLSSLPTSIQEQLSSTNMEFHQEGDFLYCLGGYGYSPTKGDHTT